jgi:hypothetical protein
MVGDRIARCMPLGDWQRARRVANIQAWLALPTVGVGLSISRVCDVTPLQATKAIPIIAIRPHVQLVNPRASRAVFFADGVGARDVRVVVGLIVRPPVTLNTADTDPRALTYLRAHLIATGGSVLPISSCAEPARFAI